MSDKDEQSELVFHYKREDRLENASKTVKDYYDGTGPTPPKGIFEALVHTKSARYSLFALLLVLAFFVGFYFFGSKSYEDTLDGVHYKLTAFTFEDNVYVSIKLESDAAEPNAAKSEPDATEPNAALPDFTVQIFAIDNDNQIIEKKNFSKNDVKDSYLRTTFVNHDIIMIKAEVKSSEDQESTIELSCKVGNEK
ncbi:MAG: hypothetical protein K6G52_08855 [Treponemataceae bacterium]|nr:hypothetical protein [Treponemataceae bacterium]